MRIDVFGEIEHRECPKDHVFCGNVVKGSAYHTEYLESADHHVGVFAYDRFDNGLPNHVPAFRKMTQFELLEYAEINH